MPATARKAQTKKAVKGKVVSVETGAAVFPWERQPGESVQAYTRFVAYRNTPAAERSQRKLGVAPSLAFRWAKEHDWTERCDQYDDWLASLADGISVAASLAHRGKTVRLADRALDKSLLALETLNTKKMSSGAIMELATGAVALARPALGLSDMRQLGSASPVNVGVGVVWGGEHPPWLAKPNASGTDEGQPNEGRIERKSNGRVKVLANDLPAAGGVHAPSPLDIEITPAAATIKEKD